VIAARSYVAVLAAGTPPDPAGGFNARRRVHAGPQRAWDGAGYGGGRCDEHGAGGHHHGVAPKAFLAATNLRSPGVHDYTDDAAIAQALEDALADGMDIAVLSLGSPAFSGPLDQGRFAACRRGLRAMWRLRRWRTRSARG